MGLNKYLCSKRKSSGSVSQSHTRKHWIVDTNLPDSTTAGGHFWRGSVTLNLGVGTRSLRVGRTVELTVQVRASGTPIEGAEVHLAFDPALLRVESVAPGTRLDQVIVSTWDNAAGTIDYAAGRFSDFPSGTFTLARVRLTALAAGTSAVVVIGADVGSGGATGVTLTAR